MLWRVSHGNIFVKFADIDEAIEDPKTGDMLDKAVFIVFYQVNRNIPSRLGSVAFVLVALLLFCVLLFDGVCVFASLCVIVPVQWASNRDSLAVWSSAIMATKVVRLQWRHLIVHHRLLYWSHRSHYWSSHNADEWRHPLEKCSIFFLRTLKLLECGAEVDEMSIFEIKIKSVLKLWPFRWRCWGQYFDVNFQYSQYQRYFFRGRFWGQKWRRSAKASTQQSIPVLR